MQIPTQRQRVSVFFRILAWFLLAASSLAAVLLVLVLFTSKPWTLPLPDTLFMVGALPLALWASGYVALTGRQPSWMTRIELAHDQRFAQVQTAAPSLAGVIIAVSIMSAMVLLLLFGTISGSFNEPIFVVVLAAAVASTFWAASRLIRYARSKRRHRSSNDASAA